MDQQAADQPPIGFPSIGQPPEELAGIANSIPVIASLVPDKPSPQEAGAKITWTVKAFDPDGDMLSYRFQQREPSPGSIWKNITGWTRDDSWTWTTTQADVGVNQIRVLVRDGKHGDTDASMVESYEITAPVAPTQPQIQIPTQAPTQIQSPIQAPTQQALAQTNSPPTINMLIPSPMSPLTAGTDVTWTANAADPDGDQILYRFFLSGPSTGGSLTPMTGWVPENTWIWMTSEANVGGNQIEVRVRDGKHADENSADDSKSASFTISAPVAAPASKPVAPINRPPTISSLTPDKPGPQVAGITVTWTANAADPDGDPILYRFVLNNQPIGGWTADNTWTWTTTDANVGGNQIEVQVRDGKHADENSADDSKSASFTITAPNRPPAISSLGPDKPSPQVAGTTVTWTANAADPDGDPILYRFVLNNQPVTDWASGNTLTWTTTDANVGDNQIEVQVRDGKHADTNGADDRKSAAFTITAPNRPPALNSLTPDKPSPQVAGTAITWTANAADPDGDQILYRFVLNNQPVTDWASGNTLTWTTTDANVGDNQIEVQVRDGKHADPNSADDSKSAAFTITAQNRPPVVNSLTSDKQSPQEAGTAITWTANAVDPDGDNILYRFLLNGKPVTNWAADNTWPWATTDANVGDSQVEVQVRDGKHADPNNADDSKSASFTITAPNRPPAISSLGPDKPSPQVAGTAITWTANAADPDRDPILYRFILNDQPVTDWTTGNTWAWTTTDANVGDSQIEVQVRDGKHADPNSADDSKSAGFTITAPNRPPVVNNLTSDKQSPQEAGTAVTWTADAADPDRDQILYRFFLNGQPVTDWAVNNKWIWRTTAASVGDGQIEVRVRDGKHADPNNADDSKSAGFTITAQNRPPVVNSLTPDKPSPQEAGTTINWTADAADPDGDQILYRFFLSGKPVTDWTADSTWIWTTASTNVGNNQVEVRIRDGKHADPNNSDASKSAAFTITAPNRLPVVNSLNSDKQSPQVAGAAITWTANAADPDGDRLLYRFFLNTTPVTDWIADNKWVWKTTEANVGDSQIEVWVRDGKHADPNNADDNKSASFTITAPNRPPALNSLTPDKPSPQEAGTTVNWTADAADPDGDKMLYRFFLNSRPVTDWTPNNVWIWKTTQANIGSNQIGVWIRDGLHAGTEGSDDRGTESYVINAPTIVTPAISQAANVTPTAPARVNQTPKLTGLVPDKTSPQAAGTIINWTANAADPDEDQILYRFMLNGQPMTDWMVDNTWTWNTTGVNAGSAQVEVRVRDDKHADANGFDDRMTESFVITAPQIVRPPVTVPAAANVTPAAPARVNQTPVLNSLVPDKTSPQAAGTTTNWTANASDPDGDQILYKFFLKGPSTNGQSVGKTGWTTDNTWTWNTADADVGNSQIEVQVRDGLHANENSFDSNKVAEFTVTARPPAPATANVTPAVSPAGENTPPALHSLTPDKPSPQLSGASIVWTANASDPDGDQILYRFFLNGPSTGSSWKPETDWAADSTWTWKTTSADVGGNQIRVWVRDGKHANADSSDSEQTAFFTITAPVRNISGMKFNDLNGNGAKDANEPGLASWIIALAKPDGSEVSTITGADGSYKFDGLAPGSYTISETAQTGWTATAPEGGSQKVTLGDSDLTNINFGNKLSAFSISGRKFNDLNGNGVNDGEPGLADWKIQLAQNGNVVNTTTTGADGSYKFDGIAPGTYTVSEVLQTGWTQTAPKGGSQSVTVQNKDVTGIDFGNKISATWALSGMKFNDLNGNGAKDADEPGLAGWNIQLAQGGSVVNGTSTAADGSYKFTGLAPGSYTVSEVLQSGWAQTAPKSGSHAVTLSDGDVTGLDFGNKGNVSISSKKYFDINKNGIQDPGEPGIPGLTVHLQENDKEIATTTTDNDGSYKFTGLLPGTYTVIDPVPSGFTVTTSSTVTVTVTSTTTIITNANFGIIGPYAISGTKFNDLNGNGVKDSGEPGISAWGIVLTGNTWFGFPLPPQTVNTAADGSYSFSGLIPGTYTVSEVSRTGWTQTAPSGGSHTVTFNFGAPPSTATGKDFGNRLLTPPGTGSIAGVKFNDLNGNGVNNGDPGLSGWTIQLKNATNSTVIRTATTDATGGYTFINLPPGGYIVSEVLKTGWTQTAPSGGSYTFTLSAGESKIGIDFGNYNQPPINPTLVPSPPSPRPVGTPITWTATAQDPNGDPLQYRFFIRAPGGALLRDTHYISSNTWVWNTAGLFPGTYQAEVWIRDGFHAGPSGYDIRTTASFTLTQGNRPPAIDFLFADRPSPQFAGSWVKWTTIAHDLDGDQLQYRYFLRGPSTFGFWEAQTGWTANNRWIWQTNGFDVGLNEVLVLVRDGHHAGPNGWDDYDVRDFAIIAVNTPPVITSLATSVPSPAPVGVAVTWKATALDPDRDLLFYRYWMKGPSTGGLWKLVRDWSTDGTWTWLTKPSDIGVSQVDVQVRDGYHAGPLGWDDDASALFTILRPNLPPKLVSLAPDKPSPKIAGTPVRWIAAATDPDGNPVLYRFWLKGPSTGNTWKIAQDWSYSNTWLWTSTPNDMGDYSVYVYARDGYHAGPNGYDSALGQSYTLQNPLMVRKLTSGATMKNMPSLVFTGDSYLLAYQSFALGPRYQGDIYLQKFDPTWNMQRSMWAANDTVYEGSPSVIFANGYYYVAYASKKTGNLNIFMKRFDANLKYVDTKQLTNSVTDQDSPSLVRLGNEFFMAYQSWDTGSQNGGDIFLTRFDQNWNQIATIHVTDQTSNQNHPSLVFASGSFYVAYTSSETGSMNIFVKRYDPNLNFLDARRITYDSSDHDYPSLNWVNGQFMLLYGSNKAGTYDIYLDRYLRDWRPVDSTAAIAAPGDQTSSSMAYSAFDGLYWVAYASTDPEGQNVYVKPLKLASPSPLKPCDIVPSFSSTRAYSPYTFTLKFYNNYGELADPLDLSFIPPQDSARPTDQLQRTSPGTLQFSSVFGAPGDKSFRIGANIDGCIAAEIVPVKVT